MEGEKDLLRGGVPVEPLPEGPPQEFEVRWQRALLFALPVAILGFAIAGLLGGSGGRVSAFDRTAYPLMAGALLLLEVLLAARPRSLRLVVFAVVGSASAFFLGKLVDLLFFSASPETIQPGMTESFFWIPVLYVLSALVPGVRGGRFVSLLFSCLILLVSATYLVLRPFGAEGLGATTALIQLNLANGVMLALTFAFIGFKEHYTRERSRMEAVRQYALTDPLTGLPNLRGAELAFRQMLVSASRTGAPMALFFIDIDRFKVVNDTLGHAAGDALLVQLANRLKANLRAEDLLARLGSDEFVLLAHSVSGEQTAERIADRIFTAVIEPFRLDEVEMAVTVSIGAALFPRDGDAPETLLRKADSAMYTVKRSGKNGLRFYAEATDGRHQQRQELERDLRDALHGQQFALHYQPMYDLDTGELAKVEALLRWNHPERGPVPPDEFLPVAEESGLIVGIGSWVLHEACRQVRAWQVSGLNGFRIAVNVSPLQFAQPTFLDSVLGALRESGLEASCLELEVTERLVLDRDADEVAGLLRKIRSLGITIAIDDFGTGYSSLSYLRDLPIDCLKVDRSFVGDLSSGEEIPQFTLALVEAIGGLASHLQMQIVAEGVEDSDQCILLRNLGFHLGQGSWFARPMEAPEFEAAVRPANHLPGEDRLRLVN